MNKSKKRKETEYKKFKLLKQKYDGKTFNNVLVIEILNSKIWKNHRACRCKCTCCGYKFIHSFTHIKSGKPAICNKCRPKKVGKRRTLPNLKAIKNRVLQYYKKGARQRQYVWEVEDEFVLKLMEEPCYYCGDLCSNNTVSHSQVWPHNGIDRLNNSLGYINENIVPCCRHCNTIKMAMNYDAFIEKIKKIYNNRIMK